MRDIFIIRDEWLNMKKFKGRPETLQPFLESQRSYYEQYEPIQPRLRESRMTHNFLFARTRYPLMSSLTSTDVGIIPRLTTWWISVCHYFVSWSVLYMELLIKKKQNGDIEVEKWF